MATSSLHPPTAGQPLPAACPELPRLLFATLEHDNFFKTMEEAEIAKDIAAHRAASEVKHLSAAEVL